MIKQLSLKNTTGIMNMEGHVYMLDNEDKDTYSKRDDCCQHQVSHSKYDFIIIMLLGKSTMFVLCSARMKL